MRASVVQMSPSTDRDANMETAERLIARAAADGAGLVSLPEMWSCLGGSLAEKRAAAEVLPGALAAFMAARARAAGVWLHGGSIGELGGDGRLYNTTLVFSPEGEEVGRYRKIHLFDVETPGGASYRESAQFGAGREVVVCRAGEIALGLSICYDVRFPELYGALRARGAQAVAVPSAFTVETGRDHWEVLLRARAIETQCFVLAAATVGEHVDGQGRPRQTWGHAMICDPWGRVLAACAEGEGVATAALDLSALEAVRRRMPVETHRRLS